MASHDIYRLYLRMLCTTLKNVPNYEDVFAFQDWWDAFLTNRGFPLWLGYIPKIMLAVVISLMDEAYFKIAVWLNDKGK